MNKETINALLGSRLVTFLSVGLGGVFILIAVALLLWSENKVINTARSHEQGAAIAITIKPERVDPETEGKLVHLTSDAASSATLTDPDFGIGGPFLRMSREVELYQWKETKHEPKKKDGDPEYSYDLVWSKEKPSTFFHEPSGHKNLDKKPYDDNQLNADDVKVGAFTLATSQIKQIPVNETLTVTEEMLAKLPDEIKDRAKVDSEGRLYVPAHAGGDPGDPLPGDVRIRFKVAKPQKISLLAQQKQATFADFPTEAGESINLLEPGEKSAQQLIAAAGERSRFLNWLIRGVCLVLLAVGVAFICRWAVADVADMAPESIKFNVGVGLFAFGVALAAVLFLVGVRWVFYQPLLGIVLVLLAPLLFAAVIGGSWFFQPGIFASLYGGSKKWTAEERDYFRRTALDADNAILRLQLAAVLENKRDPLGEFIRISTELESLNEFDPRSDELNKRWSKLLNTNSRVWFAPLRRLGLEPHIGSTFYPMLWMNHGIINTVTVDLGGILPEKAEQLFTAAPGLRVLELRNIHTIQGTVGWKSVEWKLNVPAIVQVPQLEQIGVLKMSSLSLSADDLKAVASSPYLKNLVELDFGYNRIGPDGAVSLAKSATLKRLLMLDLRSCDLGEAGAAALAAAPNLNRLVSLNVGGNALGSEGVRALAATPILQNLQHLSLDDNQCGPEGARLLAGSPHLRQLTILDLSRNDIGCDGALALSKSANLAKVSLLKLSSNALGGAGLSYLAGSPHLGKLKVLELDSNEIDDVGAKALTAATVLKQLEDLSLSYNEIGDDGLIALAGWAGLAGVNKLSLRQNKFGVAGVKALASSPHLKKVTELALSDNNIGLDGARALAASPVLVNLKYLWIGNAHLTSQGEETLRKRFGTALQL